VRRPRQPVGLVVRRGLSRWWAWTERPLSLRGTWRASAVNTARVPLGDGGLALLWKISNATDRLIMFALVLVAPTVLTGPLRWITARPTRRYGFYLIVLALTGAAVFTTLLTPHHHL
jgi:hypothetical protein